MICQGVRKQAALKAISDANIGNNHVKVAHSLYTVARPVRQLRFRVDIPIPPRPVFLWTDWSASALCYTRVIGSAALDAK